MNCKVELFKTKKTKLTVIKGFDWETEKQLSQWMHRPMRKFLEDAPYYPWLPPTPKVPRVNFDLMFSE